MPKKHRLLKRGNMFYYHRRVPPHLVDALGKKVVKVSLGMGNLSKATQLRSYAATQLRSYAVSKMLNGTRHFVLLKCTLLMRKPYR